MTRRNLAAYDMPRIAGWFRAHAAVLQGFSPVAESELVTAEAPGDEVVELRRGVDLAEQL